MTYTRQSEWTGGFVAAVGITVPGGVVNGWALAFTFPGDQKVLSAWNATVAQSGSAVVATNLAGNAMLTATSGVSFGMQGSWTSSDATPTSFTLNGVACTMA